MRNAGANLVCTRCGYPALGRPTDHCPECGLEAPPGPPLRRPRVWLVGLFYLMTSAAMCICGLMACGSQEWFSSPRWMLTMPMGVLLSVLFLYGHPWLVPLPLLTLHFGSSLLLFRRQPGIHASMLAFATLVLVGSFGWMGFQWSYRDRWSAPGHAWKCVAFNAAFALALLCLFAVQRGKPRRALTWMFHAVVGLWITTCAFPYWGELP